MKIRLAIIDDDKTYLNRIELNFNTRYPDKFQISFFTSVEKAIENLKNIRVDIVLVNYKFREQILNHDFNAGLAYLVETQDVNIEENTIYKYQKLDLLYKQILNIFSDYSKNVRGVDISEDKAILTSFVSFAGGVGCSTLAASYSKYLAKKGIKVLYLNLEDDGVSDYFFSGDGKFTFSDVIYSIRSKSANLPIKLESFLRVDKSGVQFYSGSKVSLDVRELTTEDIKNLINNLNLFDEFEHIVLDMKFSLEKNILDIYKITNKIILVSDGEEISNTKIHRGISSLNILEKDDHNQIYPKMVIMYNKFSNKTGKVLTDLDLKNIGGVPRFEHASLYQITEQISDGEHFSNLLEV